MFENSIENLIKLYALINQELLDMLHDFINEFLYIFKTFSHFLFKVVEDGYEFFAKRQLVTLFSAPNYCGEFDNAGGMMSVDETLMCSFQVSA